MKKENLYPTTRYSFVQGSFWMSFCIILSYASVYLLSKGFHNSEIGIIIAIAGTVSAVLQPVIASVADKAVKVPLRYIIAFLAVIAVCTSTALLVPNLYWLLIAIFYAVLLAVLQILTPLINALGMQCVNRGIPVNFGVARGVGSIAFAAASFAAGNIIENYGTTIIPIMIIAFYSILLIAGLTFRFSMADKEIEPDRGTALIRDREKGGFAFLKQYRKFFLLLLGITLVFISHNMLNGYVFQIVSYHDGGSKEMGIVIAIAAMVELPTMMAFSVINKKISCSTLLKVAGTFFALKAVLTWMAVNLTMIYAVQLIQILGFALFIPASVYYVNQLMKDKDRVKGQAFMTMTNTLGSIGGSLFGGILLDQAGVPVMLFVSSLAAVLGAVIIYISTEKCARGGRI